MSELFDGQPTPATTNNVSPSHSHVWRYVPYGYEIVQTHQEYRLYGAYVSGLSAMLNTCGGHWSQELLAYVLPLGRAPQIDSLLRKYQQQEEEFDALMDKLAAHIEPTPSVKSANTTQKHQQQAIASRHKVIADQYQTRDLLQGKPIMDFGKRWQEFPSLRWEYAKQGTCQCCGLTKSLNHKQTCRPCAAQLEGIPAVTYCYAYFG